MLKFFATIATFVIGLTTAVMLDRHAFADVVTGDIKTLDRDNGVVVLTDGVAYHADPASLRFLNEGELVVIGFAYEGGKQVVGRIVGDPSSTCSQDEWDAFMAEYMPE
jgi:hypothetical protein